MIFCIPKLLGLCFRIIKCEKATLGEPTILICFHFIFHYTWGLSHQYQVSNLAHKTQPKLKQKLFSSFLFSWVNKKSAIFHIHFFFWVIKCEIITIPPQIITT